MRRYSVFKITAVSCAVLSIAIASFLVFVNSRHDVVLQSPGESFSAVDTNAGATGGEQASASPEASYGPSASCSNPQRRFIAVMLAGDSIARPLAGITKADIVAEIPVITGSITRFLVFFSCEDASEIGSIRSARDDFIPLAAAFDAVYAHWGGSHFALARLRAGVIDNIDALVNPYGAFFRKRGIAPPHNGFSSTGRLYASAQKLGYRLEKRFEDYPRRPSNDQLPAPSNVEGSTSSDHVTIGYPGPFRVEWYYNAEKGLYERWRGGTPERDALDGTQVTTANVVIMKTTSRQIEGQYNDVRVVGEGKALMFVHGQMLAGTWSKTQDSIASRLRFKDIIGDDIPLAPGNIWIEVADQTTAVNY